MNLHLNLRSDKIKTMTESTGSFQPEPLSTEDKNKTDQVLGALMYAAVADKTELFIESQVYPPYVINLLTAFRSLEGFPINAIFSLKRDLGRIEASGISKEEYDKKLSKLNDLEQRLTSSMNKRLKPINDLIFQLIPDKDELKEENGRMRYPEAKIQEIFDQPEAKYGIRAINFLLDTAVINGWLVLEDEEFNKFCQMLREHNLPSGLVSDEEMKRLWQWEREGDAYEMHRMRDLARQSHPNVPDWERPAPVANSGSDAVERMPARYAFLDLYSEFGNLNKAIEELGRLYPNEHVPSST